jgi:hypothetical protein
MVNADQQGTPGLRFGGRGIVIEGSNVTGRQWRSGARSADGDGVVRNARCRAPWRYRNSACRRARVQLLCRPEAVAAEITKGCAAQRFVPSLRANRDLVAEEL